MDIALTGLNQQFGSSISFDNASQRQRQDAQQQVSAGNDRAQQNRNLENPSSQNQTRAETNQRTPTSTENSRVINGEVLSSDTRRVDSGATSDASGGALFSRSGNQQPTGQPDNRRISAQQAIQTFQENEDLVPVDNQQRQVSGIIDTFV